MQVDWKGLPRASTMLKAGSLEILDWPAKNLIPVLKLAKALQLGLNLVQSPWDGQRIWVFWTNTNKLGEVTQTFAY